MYLQSAFVFNLIRAFEHAEVFEALLIEHYKMIFYIAYRAQINLLTCSPMQIK